LANGTTQKLSSLRIPTYLSPAEPRDEVRIESGVANYYPCNYGVNLGTWFVYDPATKKGGGGAAYPNSKLNSGHFRDGTTNTLGFAEVKAWRPYYRNAAKTAAADLVIPTINSTTVTANNNTLCALCTGGEFNADTGHTEWVDGRAHQIGFTTTFRPNELVLCTQSTGLQDIDFTNWQEGKDIYASTPNTTPTYAAITARSYFSGIVNVTMMDGSVRAIANNVDLGVWRALSTRDGKEMMPDDVFK